MREHNLLVVSYNDTNCHLKTQQIIFSVQYTHISYVDWANTVFYNIYLNILWILFDVKYFYAII